MPGIEILHLAAVLDVVRVSIMVLFVISAFLVILVVLAQEGKGGGLAGAFGGAGTETFGVKAGTVNKFTAWVGGLFLGLALLYAGLASATTPATKGKDAVDTTRFEKGVESGDAKDADAKDSDAKDADAKDGAPKKDADTPEKDADGDK